MVSRIVDSTLDLTVVPGFSRIGYALRRQTWPARGRITERLDGRTVLVTGATSGIGRAAAEGFAGLGARVVLLARDAGKARAACTEIAAATGNDDLAIVVADLSRPSEARAAAARVAATEDALHVLVHNAGVLAAERTVTEDGLELTFATNVLAPYVLTEELTGLLAPSAPSRVITVSSGGMYTQRVDLEDLQTAHRDYDGPAVYARTKRAQVLLTEMWARRFADRGVVVHAMHPGWADTPGVQQSLPRFRALTRPILRTAAQGADTVVWLGAAAEPATSTGRFWHDRRPRPVHRLSSTRERPGDAERLAQRCADLAGLLVPPST